MKKLKTSPAKISGWHVGVAAEAIAAAQFARLGLDVSVQYGANQPEYDLIVVKAEKILKISVKGSQDGGWGLTQSFIKNADYHGAINSWEKRHHPKTVFCFVQFKGVSLNDFPRMYLASPAEIAEQMKKSANGRGDTILYENHTWTEKAQGAGSTDRIPEHWKFSAERVNALLMQV